MITIPGISDHDAPEQAITMAGIRRQHITICKVRYMAICHLFLYRHVLERDLGWLENVTRAKRSRRLPVVFTCAEAWPVHSRLEGRE